MFSEAHASSGDPQPSKAGEPALPGQPLAGGVNKLANSPWFKFFAADFLLDPDVDDLPLEAQAILLRMWCVCWIEGYLPNDVERISLKCRILQTTLQKHMQTLMQMFLQKDGKLISERMEVERAKSKIISKARKEAALKSHENRGDASFADGFADANSSANVPAKTVHSDSDSKRSDSDTNSKSKTRTKPSSRCASTDTLFDKAYEQYPRHVGKRAAEKAWTRALVRAAANADFQGETEDFMYQRVMTYAAVCERAHKEKQFIPHMATWLNQDRFMDDPTEWAVKENGNGKQSKLDRTLQNFADLESEERSQTLGTGNGSKVSGAGNVKGSPSGDC